MDTQDQAVKLATQRWWSIFVSLVLLLGDVLGLSLAFSLATLIRTLLLPVMGGVILWDLFVPLLRLILISILITFALMNLYPGFGRSAVEEMRLIFNALTVGYGVLGLAVYFQQAGLAFARSIFVMSWGLAFVFIILIRFYLRNRISRFRWWGMPVVIVGGIADTRDVVERLLRSRRLGLRPVAIFDENSAGNISPVKGMQWINSRSMLKEWAAQSHINYAVLVETADRPRQDMRQLLGWLSTIFPTLLVVLADSPLGSLWVKTMDLEGRLTLQAHYHLLNRRAIISKRIFDLLISLGVLVLTSPVWLFLAGLIRLDSPGSVFYSQQRLGLNGKPFQLLKFRTMISGAEGYLEKLMQEDSKVQQEYQKYHKLANDPRITRIGKFLRKYSLDELPQIWNILRGDMSLVGPRAYLPAEHNDMGDYADLIFKIRPGITGWWQVMGRHTTTFLQRLRLDEYYLGNWSLWLDIYILIKTAWVVMRGLGA